MIVALRTHNHLILKDIPYLGKLNIEKIKGEALVPSQYTFYLEVI